MTTPIRVKGRLRVKEFREWLNMLPDDALVVQTGSDHSYHFPRISYEDIVEETPYDFTEYWKEIHQDSKVVKAVIIGE